MLAMQAIREVNPAASLIQTEDAGRTGSTPMLAYQARQDNHRRWLTMDLLTGRVVQTHPLWFWLLEAGASPAHLAWMAEHPCPPDVVGLNYYLTSDRHLDEALEHYPEWSHGGNGRHRYADIEAVRAHAGTFCGHEGILMEAWNRYGLPVALTEVHAGGSREDQMRWLARAWEGAHRARDAGAAVRAITLWSLFGSVDWNSLCVQCDDVYEAGLFDARSNPPRATALGRVVRALVTDSELEPVVQQPGWWERPERLHWGRPLQLTTTRQRPQSPFPPILITGANGTLGRALVAACADRALAHVPLGRHELDVTDPASIRSAIERWRPWAIVNAAGYVRVDDAEREPDVCLELNADAAAALAHACAGFGVRLVTYSSDLVFDGEVRRPYIESDAPHPLNVYGISKLLAEARVQDALPEALIVRTSAFFGPTDRHNFVTGILRDLAEGRVCRAASDAVVSPTYVPDLAHATLDLLMDHEQGIWHLANRGEITWFALARLAAEQAGMNVALIRPVALRELQLVAPRPSYSALGSIRGAVLPSLESAMARYIEATGARSTENQLG
jgi:dTDP-4-dehydrorhamnose reductase